MKKFTIALFAAIISISCSKRKNHLQGDWIIVDLEYKGQSIVDKLSFRNIAIDFDSGLVSQVPYIYHGPEVPLNRNYKTEINYEETDDKEYLIISGSDFFTDKFEIECLGKACCRFVLTAEDKKVECIYNGPLSPFEKRRDCPSPELFL